MKTIFIKVMMTFVLLTAWCISSTAADTEAPTVDNDIVTLEKRNNNYVYLKWNRAKDNVTDIKKIVYSVSYRKMSDKNWTERTYRCCTDANYVDYLFNLNEGDLTNETICFMVKALDQAGNKLTYAQANINYSMDNQSPQLLGYGYHVVNTTSQSIKITWREAIDDKTPQEKLKYQVICAGDNGSSFTHEVIGKNECVINGLKPSTLYAINIFIWDENLGYSILYPLDELVTVKTTAASSRPEIPDRTLTLVERTDNFIQVSWSKAFDNVYPSEDLVYSLMYRKEGTSAWTTVKSLKNWISGGITNLSSNTSYEILVQAANSGYSVSYDKLIVKTLSYDNEPPKVSDPTITFEEISPSAVRISWKPATDNLTKPEELRYKIFFKEVADDTPLMQIKPVTLWGKCEYSFPNFNRNTQYTFRVIVYDNNDHDANYDMPTFVVPLKISSDVNNDGVTDISDVTKLVNTILGK